MENPLIIALDFSNRQETARFLEHFEEEQLFVKVGMELFYQEGPSLIEYLKEKGHQIFLDLKLHDIPNTVQKAMEGLAKLGCDLVNVHAAGGSAMMQAAVEGLEAGTLPGAKRPYCIAVTQLTSTSEEQMNKEQLISVPLSESVFQYARLAKESGLDGVVCSPYEVNMLNSRLGKSFLTVTPGIRMESEDKQDQKRVSTPQFARVEGASAIVVGRSITMATNPFHSYQLIKKAWEGERIEEKNC